MEVWNRQLHPMCTCKFMRSKQKMGGKSKFVAQVCDTRLSSPCEIRLLPDFSGGDRCACCPLGSCSPLGVLLFPPSVAMQSWSVSGVTPTAIKGSVTLTTLLPGSADFPLAAGHFRAGSCRVSGSVPGWEAARPRCPVSGLLCGSLRPTWAATGEPQPLRTCVRSCPASPGGRHRAPSLGA